MSKYKDVSGKKFGRLTAIKRVGSDRQRCSIWKCKCDCGKEVEVRLRSLTSGNTKSCGCLHSDVCREMKTEHGLSVDSNGKTPRLYSIWKNMKQRCSNPNASKYEIYGGKGISVCEEWQEYINFHNWAMENGYDDDLTIDRIDNEKNYSPENCRWASYKEQSLNTSQNRIIKFNGKSLTVTEWARRLNIKRSTLDARINEYGWSIKRALNEPVAERS